jgi:excisionase family DNA binding protein
MTTKELAKYLKLNEITIGKYAAKGLIPAIRIGGVWRFHKEVIDQWIAEGQNKPPVDKKSKTKAISKHRKKHLPKEQKNKR